MRAFYYYVKRIWVRTREIPHAQIWAGGDRVMTVPTALHSEHCGPTSGCMRDG